MTDQDSGAETSEKSEETPKIYRNQGPRAQYIKALTQMLVGVAAAIAIVSIAVDLTLRRYTGAGIEEHVFATIGVALAVGAGIELAYTLFTHGPDEALDPLMLGLSAVIVLQLGRVHSFDLKQSSSAIIYVIALGGTFAIRKYLADDPKVGKPDWSSLGKLAKNVWRFLRHPINNLTAWHQRHSEKSSGNTTQGGRQGTEAVDG